MLTAVHRAAKDHINIRILQTMIPGVPLILGLGTRMSDPYVCVVFGPLVQAAPSLCDTRIGTRRFPIIRGPILGVPVMKIIACLGLFWSRVFVDTPTSLGN